MSGDTSILTNASKVPFKLLAGNAVNVWNGCEYSQALVVQTNTNQKLYRVELSDGSWGLGFRVWIKKDEKFVEMQTLDLMVGDTNMPAEYYPIVLESNEPTTFVIPFTVRVSIKLQWLAKRLDDDAGYVQISLPDRECLRKVKVLVNTLGTNPFLVESPRGHHLHFSSPDAETLIVDLALSTNKLREENRSVYPRELRVAAITELPGTHDNVLLQRRKYGLETSSPYCVCRARISARSYSRKPTMRV